MGSLRTELNKLRRDLDTLPGDGQSGKWVLPARVWGAIAGGVPWSDLTPDELAAWEEYREWVDRTYPARDIETELTTLNQPEEHP